MADKIMQCCYSNVRSGTGAAGWQVTAASENVPLELRKKYGLLQDTNVAFQEPRDENGNPLRLFELVVQDGCLYLTRVTYGLTDERGRRNNMLSHSYLFLLNEGALEDPNVFLTVTDENFTGDIDEAAVIPKAFVRSAAYTRADAMALCGLDEARYLKLIYCLYAQRENRRTLFLHTKKGKAVIRPLLYCIWTALPLYMRRELSCADAVVNPNNIRTLIVSSRHEPGELYFDLETGENNVLDERGMKKYARWGYVDYGVACGDPAESNRYYRMLEEVAVSLGDAKGAKPKVLKIAGELLMQPDFGAMDFNSLQSRLYEALRAPVQRTNAMDAYISRLLDGISAAERVLDPEVESALLEHMKEPGLTDEIKQSGETYIFNKILRSSPEEGAAILAAVAREPFQRYRRELAEQGARGAAYLDLYYAGRCPADASWEALDAFTEEMDEYGDIVIGLNGQTRQALIAQYTALYERELIGEKNAQESYLSYTRHRQSISLPGEDETQIDADAKRLYWKHFAVADFDYAREREYLFFALRSDAVCMGAMGLRNVYYQLDGGMPLEAELIKNMNRFIKGAGDALDIRTAQKVGKGLSAFMDEKAYKAKDRNDYARLFYLLLMLKGSSFVQESEQYITFLKERDEAALLSLYETRAEALREHPQREKILEQYNQFWIKRADEQNLTQRISLDVLLTLGESMYANPFEILEHSDQLSHRLRDIWHQDAETLAQSSRLLKEERYAAYADTFETEDDVVYNAISGWMAAVKRLQKTKGGSVFGGLMGTLRRPGGREEEPEQTEGSPARTDQFDAAQETAPLCGEQTDLSTKEPQSEETEPEETVSDKLGSAIDKLGGLFRRKR